MMMGGFFTDTRYRGQEGAAKDAPVFSSTGSLGLTGFLMGNPAANPLDYVEGETNTARRQQLAAWLDSVNPDLSSFMKRGGKLIVVIGTADTLASPGSQLDYYQSVLDRMGRKAVDSFARFYVLPQTGHGLTGTSYTMDGNGKSIAASEIPSGVDRVALLRDWVEKGIAPAKSVTVTGPTGSRPMCSYPDYPRYIAGDPAQAAAYLCTAPGG
jgi:feruloyl esterase